MEKFKSPEFLRGQGRGEEEAEERGRVQQEGAPYCVPGQVRLPGAAAPTCLSAACRAPQESRWTRPLPEQRITVYMADEKRTTRGPWTI